MVALRRRRAPAAGPRCTTRSPRGSRTPAVAALLIAKASLAGERGVELRLLPESHAAARSTARSRATSPPSSATWSTTRSTLPPRRRPTGAARVDVLIDRRRRTRRRCRSRDSGPGVRRRRRQVFRQGCSTKASATEGARGFGLALTRLVCRRRGGDVTVRNDDGAVFTATLPVVGATTGARGRDAMIEVLVVDDDFMVARIHTGFVERTPGFTVTGVAQHGRRGAGGGRAAAARPGAAGRLPARRLRARPARRPARGRSRGRRAGHLRRARGRHRPPGAARRDRALPGEAVLLRRPAGPARALPAGVRRDGRRAHRPGRHRPGLQHRAGTGQARCPRASAPRPSKLVEDTLRAATRPTATSPPPRRPAARHLPGQRAALPRAPHRARAGRGRACATARSDAPERRYAWRRA